MKAPNIDQIRKLWMLDLIIQSGSLKDAALRAGVSPSAVSQSLKSLEGSVGHPLVIRNRGSVSPTPEAISILSAVRPAFAAFERLSHLGPVPAPKMSWLNFGTYESLAIDILPGLIQRIRDLMPHLRLGLRISRTPNLLTMIRTGELHSALITQTDDLDRFYVQEVRSDQLGFFVARKHPIASLEWSAVRSHGVGVLAPGKDGWPRYFSRFMKQLGDVQPVVRSDSFEALRAAASAGALVAVLPLRVAKRRDDLLEIHPPIVRNRERGEHKILVVSKSNSDTAEVDFLAAEAKRLLL